MSACSTAGPTVLDSMDNGWPNNYAKVLVIISSCQSAAIFETVKAFLASNLTHASSDIIITNTRYLPS